MSTITYKCECGYAFGYTGTHPQEHICPSCQGPQSKITPIQSVDSVATGEAPAASPEPVGDEFSFRETAVSDEEILDRYKDRRAEIRALREALEEIEGKTRLFGGPRMARLREIGSIARTALAKSNAEAEVPN